MKNTYPIILTPEETGFSVYIPDFAIGTQGDTLTDAIGMARDAIGLAGIDRQDDGKPLPQPSRLADVPVSAGDMISLVDVDFTEYRRQNELRAVKKNCTIPAWLCYAAEKANINFSQALQDALRQQLHLSGPQA